MLHVQSRSEWAPCCIGPYSQATQGHGGLLWFAGQIGLQPPTMQLLEGGPLAEVRAWLHVWGRVVKLVKRHSRVQGQHEGCVL